MPFWKFRKQEPVDSYIAPPPKQEELLSMAEEMGRRRMPERINERIQKAIDASAYFELYNDYSGNYFGSEFDIRATAGRIKSTYKKEPWIWTAGTLLARAMETVPMRVIDNATDEVLENHPLNKQIKASNDLQDNMTINYNGALDFCLGGNFFRVFNEDFTKQMQVPVQNVALEMNAEQTKPSGIKVWDSSLNQFGSTIPIEQVIHHKYPNPDSPFVGLSLFIAASRPIILDRYKNEFEMAFYLRGATNSGVIETEKEISKTRMERLMRTYEQVYTGKRNWWRTIFLPAGAKWVSSGLTMNEMQHLEGLRENRLTILAVLGIPPSLVGIVQDVNRSTSEEQSKHFWQNTVTPLVKFKAAGWNNSHLVKVVYKNAVRVEPDFSGIPELQGSMKQKGEEAQAVQNYLTIDEIRTDILGYEELPNGLGEQFVSQVKPEQDVSSLFGLSAPQALNPVNEVVEDTEPNRGYLGAFKAQVVESQNRIEKRLSAEFVKGYDSYIEAMLDVVINALNNNKDVRKALRKSETKLMERYFDTTWNVFVAALERGFRFANNQAKSFNGEIRRKRLFKKVVFSTTDQEAIEVLRDQGEEGQLTTLEARSIESFQGFNANRTEQIMNIIAEGLEEGETNEQIAASIRTTYGESYKDQAFTVARTETLTAVSQGIKWNSDILAEVFSEVQKQWLHVGDSGSNPDARLNHVEFENEGPVPKDHVWGGVLEYPRDPQGGADETINCRCSMVSVIPDDAQSNADEILAGI